MGRPRTVLSALLLIVAACAESGSDDAVPQSGATGAAVSADPALVPVRAEGLTLQMPDSVPSGWLTFEFVNASPMTHFALVEKVPEGQGLASHQEEIAPIFQEGYDLLIAGDGDGAMARFGELPAWFGEVVFIGGPGLTAPGRTSRATIHLDPGTYLVECYVKTDGVFHSYNPDPDVYGMVAEFTVTEAPSGASEPTPSLRITLSGADGIEVEGEPTAGEHIVAVHFEDQTTYENFVGHDVHLVRLADGISPEEVEPWMNSMLAEGLSTPAPADFIGGLNEMPAGRTGYFTVTLEAGEDYAWISEVPGAADKGLLRAFSVPAG